MDHSKVENYDRIAKAIEFVQQNFKSQPTLDEIAEHVNLSSFHFHRIFTEWAGTTPTKFLHYTSLQYAKGLLKEHRATLFDVAYETGLSSTSRLHDMFIKIEGMSPAAYKNGAPNLNINYSFSNTIFGNVIVASTQKGICFMAFYDSEDVAYSDLLKSYPEALISKQTDEIQKNALTFFSENSSSIKPINLHLKGTPFQLNVWQALLKIPLGKIDSYGNIANVLNKPNASRAVGTAIGSNPVAFLIPCHRVLQASGNIGGYRWGTTRKSAMIGWEASLINKNDEVI